MEDPLLLVIGCLVIAACIFGLGFLSFSEAALLGISEIRLRALCKNGDPRAALLRQLVASNQFLTAIIVGVNICVITISTIMTVIVSRSALHGTWHEEVIHVGMLFFMLVAAEIAPKTYGALFAERVALRVARPISALLSIVSPLMTAITAIAHSILSLVGAKAGDGIRFVTKDEIRVAADVSEEEGVLAPAEGEMIDSVLELGMAKVSEIMVPRVDIVALDENHQLEHILQVVIESGHSRIPIYSGTLDNITGILYVNDLLVTLKDGGSRVDLAAIARQPFYVPETKLLDELFAEMRERAVHLAIIVDEFGGTEGLVTIEDILEELVGDIEDEHDIISDVIVLIGEDEAVVSAKGRIEDLNEQLLVSLPDDQYDTIGGLITGLANHIPEAGEAFEIDGVVLAVEASDEQHIERVRITVKSRDGGEDRWHAKPSADARKSKS